jgi:hypothetical protein
VVPRDSFDDEWRSLAHSLANRPAGSIKRVLAGATPEQAIAAFAELWVSDEHWAAADKVMNKAK